MTTNVGGVGIAMLPFIVARLYVCGRASALRHVRERSELPRNTLGKLQKNLPRVAYRDALS